MKYFFWLSALAYVFVYFYAAWVYEDFTMPVAIFFFVLFVGFVYWRYKRHIAHQALQQSQTTTDNPAAVDRPELSLWRSPLPYIAVIALVVIIIGFQL